MPSGFPSTLPWSALLLVGSFGLLAVFAFYPLLLWLVARRRTAATPPEIEAPRVSLIIAVRNGEALMAAKLANAAALRYPAERVEIVVASDGSTDRTESIVRACGDARVVLLASHAHAGKAEALNRAARHATGEILVFTDADALLEPDALAEIVRPFGDARVGGVCGQRVIGEQGSALNGAQASYVSLDSHVKLLESRGRGSITSNDGKLHAIRGSLFRPIAEAVTDDLYTCLSVVAQGQRFVFAPRARALVRVPSRDAAHELGRRRRIVSRSLRGIWLMRALLNPLRHGLFALGLLVNKVGRRLLPVWLLLILVGSLGLARRFELALGLVVLQGAFYLAACVHPLLARAPLAARVRRWTALPFYFCVGSLGSLLGLFDLLFGKRVVRWEPRKTA